MNIAFCINNGYVEQLLVVLASLAINNKKHKIDVYVLSSDITMGSQIRINKIAACFKNMFIHFISVDRSQTAHLASTIEYISNETYYRYLLADLLPDLNKILYMDADIIVNGDVSELYNTDMDGYLLAGARDLYIRDIDYSHQIGIARDDLYINAGILLMNLDGFRKKKIGQKLLTKTKELEGKISFNDQDVLNIVCHGKILEIDSIYNYTSHNIYDEKHKIKHARIIHYTGVNKPWLVDSAHKLKYLWKKYYKKAKNLMTQHKKIKVALLIDEFFGGAGTAFGGYGALARKYIAKYIPNTDIKIDVLLGSGGHRERSRKYRVDNVNLYRLPRKHFWSRVWLWLKNYDLYLSIELTDDWVLKHEPRKNKKLILWIQDPRPQYEWWEIETVKLFKEYNYYNQQIYDTVHDWWDSGRVYFISQGFFLNPKAIDLYRLSKNTKIQYLPNPVEIDSTFDVTTYKKKNNIIFLGRIESVKRGWLFCEIAKRMPEYEFYILGQSFREKEKNDSIMSKYRNIKNLHFAGHVDGAEKTKYLKDAKILVNTSIHEALPVSFLEALAYGVCLVSNRTPEDLTSKFGIWTGQINGDGFNKLNLYIDAIKELMTDNKKRKKLAIAGRKYVEHTHNIPRFVNDLRTVIYQEAK